MRGAVFYGPGDIRVEEVPDPEPGPDEVLIEVSRNGICGSDVHTYVGGRMGTATMHVPGVVLGHEFAGIVRAVGKDVDDLAVGTAVAVCPIVWCGQCGPCRQGKVNLCLRKALYGGLRLPLHGGLAPFAAVQRRACFPVPVGLGVIEAALAEPVAVAVHAARMARHAVGSSALVTGAGPIGLAVLQCLKAAGCAPILVSELSGSRHAAAARLGATAVIDPTRDALLDVVRDFTGDGADIVIDSTAATAAFNDGIAAAAPAGTVISVGGWTDLAPIDMSTATTKQLEIRYSNTYEPNTDFPVALGLLESGAVDAATMITDHISVERVVDQGLQELLDNPGAHIKILVDSHE